jgi:hypothetical protein
MTMTDLIEIGEALFVYAKKVGDGLLHHVALADRGNTIYVALGGMYAPVAGGFFPKHMLKEFGEDLINWAYEGDGLFYDMLVQRHYWKYMVTRQEVDRIRWDLVVAWVFAWAHYRGHATNPQFLQIIGELNKSNHAKVVHILEAAFDGVPYPAIEPD